MNDTEARAALRKLLEVLYGGVPGGRPESDADQLRALADWLDKVDDTVDAAFGPSIRHDPDPRQIQTDLRRIADAIQMKGETT
jgi:hypothetical protein